MSGAGTCHWESSLFISRHGFLPFCLSIVAYIRRSEDNNNPRGTFSPVRANSIELQLTLACTRMPRG